MTGPRIKYADKLSNGKGAGRLAEVDIMLSDGEHLGLDYMHITRRRYIPRGKPGGERIELVIVDDTVTIRVREGQKFDLYSLYDQINRKQLATLEPGEVLEIERADLLQQMLFTPPQTTRTERRRHGYRKQDMSVTWGLDEFAEEIESARAAIQPH